MKICICSGYPLSSPKGNSVTAKRLEKLFQSAGYEAFAVSTEMPPQADHLVVLNAIKTAAASKYYARTYPDSMVHVMLTGTDIHRDIHQFPELADEVFQVASSLIVAHPECIDEVPEQWRRKLRVIYPSVELPEIPQFVPYTSPTFTCLGHLREVKNPHLMFNALQLLNEEVKAVSLGDALEEKEGDIARANMEADARYQWLSGVDRPQALERMKQSIATINSSFLEGGSNVIVEAISLGVPVLASDIAGNRGLLGESYGGLFPSNDVKALAGLMKKCLTDKLFRGLLLEQLQIQRKLFSSEWEIRTWLDLIDPSLSNSRK